MTNAQKIIDVLKKGPTMSSIISEETGISPGQVSNLLSKMFKERKVTRQKAEADETSGIRGNPYVYGLPNGSGGAGKSNGGESATPADPGKPPRPKVSKKKAVSQPAPAPVEVRGETLGETIKRLQDDSQTLQAVLDALSRRGYTLVKQ